MDESLNNVDIDLTSVDLSRPILPKQTLLCRTGEVKVEKPEGRPRQLVIPLQLEQPGVDTNGKQVNVGFAVTDRMLLEPTGKLTQEMINERLARFQVAALGLDKPQRFGNASDYTGKTVLVTFDVRQDKEDASKQYQDVKRYNKPTTN